MRRLRLGMAQVNTTVGDFRGKRAAARIKLTQILTIGAGV
jgi:hypothetical protein